MHNKLFVNVFLATSFGSKIEPSSGHYAKTVNVEALYIIGTEISAFTSRDILHCKYI